MAFTKKTVRDIDVDGKRVLCRVDFNVPIKDGVVGDTTRISAALPTIKYLVEHNARVILMSHLGRPAGTGFEPELSLKPVAEKLAEMSGLPVSFVADTYGDEAEAAVNALEPGHVLVLENVRFDKREKKNDPEIAKRLASYGDVFVLDAFGTAHRAQGSVVGPAAYIPARCWLPPREGGRHPHRHLRRARASVRRHRRRLQGLVQDRRPRPPHRLR